MQKLREILEDYSIEIIGGLVATAVIAAMEYKIRGDFAIGGEWLIVPFLLFVISWGRELMEYELPALFDLLAEEEEEEEE